MSGQRKRKYASEAEALATSLTPARTATRQRNSSLSYALGVTLGISRKRKEEPGRIGDKPIKSSREVAVGSDNPESMGACPVRLRLSATRGIAPDLATFARRCQEIGTERRQSALQKSFTTI